MRRWLLMAVLGAVLVGCDRFLPTRTPTPLPTPTGVSTSIPAATEAPSTTPLPPTPTLAPTEVSTLASAGTATSTETTTETPLPTATSTRRPFTPRPTATAASTAVALKYAAPVLLEPEEGATRTDGKDDFLFQWKPVADLGPHECYFVTVQVINLADPNQRYSQDSWIAPDSCNSAVSSGVQQFTLRKRNPPSYAGMVADASQSTPSSKYQVRWWITVVFDQGPDPQNSGKDLTTPLSPPSAMSEFSLLSP
jgi:cytoskeletal protein RodZ